MDLQSHGVSSRFRVSERGLGTRGIGGIDEHRNTRGCGHSSRSNASRFAVSSVLKKLTPVTLPPGRARLATRPTLTGSWPTTKTMGIVFVAALAAKAA
jgi:hypothetical protein